MDPRVLDARDVVTNTEEKSSQNAWHDDARAWMSQRPESLRATASGDSLNDRAASRAEQAETPEVKEAYRQLLEKTRDVDPSVVADSINLFSNLAATGANVSKVGESLKEQGAAVGANAARPEVSLDPNAVQPEVAQAYTRLLQRGFNPVIIADVINVAGDVAAIAMSPAGRKLFEDFKTLINHIVG